MIYLLSIIVLVGFSYLGYEILLLKKSAKKVEPAPTTRDMFSIIYGKK